jgi:hypothetical protein
MPSLVHSISYARRSIWTWPTAERLFERRPRNAEPPPALVKDFLSIRRDRLERTSGAVAGHRPRLCETGGTCALRRRGCVHLRELAGLSPA